MYVVEILQDHLFIMLYGGVAMMAVLAALYLLLRRSNAIVSDVESPRELRLWAAAFLLTMAASHAWWVVFGQVWLTDDHLVRILTVIALDNMTLVPLIMAVLLRMLQDRKRPLWPVFLATVPTAVTAIVGITTHKPIAEWIMEGYVILVGVVFVGYMTVAVMKYGRWLRDNFADLEHKEVWQSLLAPLCLLPIFYLYAYHEGEFYREYLTQIISIIIIVFIILRVETLRTLVVEKEEEETESAGVVEIGMSRDVADTPSAEAVQDNSDIATLLRNRCEKPLLYLKYDLTLSDLAKAVGIRKDKLSAWFSEQGDTYNAYINHLRIDHFIRLYEEATAARRPFTVFELANQCGYRSYYSFSNAFKQRTGKTITQWTRIFNGEE